MFWSAVYLMGQWWIHMSLHMWSGLDVGKMVLIDYTFHLPMFVAGGLLTYGVVATVADIVRGSLDPATTIVHGSHDPAKSLAGAR